MSIMKITAFSTPRSSIKKEYRKYKLNKVQKEILNNAKQKYDYDKTKPVYAFIKRSLDIVGGVIGLLLTAPLIVAGAVATKLESNGPVIFNQKRLGKDGKPFIIKKLRTMYNNPEKNVSPILDPNDKRITKTGKFLRKYSIDEFPQFLNIIKGDMSLVGPRPIPPREQDIANNFPEFVERYAVKPGAKLQYRKNDMGDIHKRFKIEKDYIENWSLKKDFIILTKIFRDVIGGKNY